MLRPLSDLPPRVIGFEAVGEVHAADYRDVLRPALDQAAVDGEIRFVYVLGSEFAGYSAGADWEDAKLAFQHVRAWERTAVVTDVDWIGHAVRTLGWMAPGELKVFPLAEQDEAVRWASDLGPRFAPYVSGGAAAGTAESSAGEEAPDEVEAPAEPLALEESTGPEPPTPVVVGGFQGSSGLWPSTPRSEEPSTVGTADATDANEAPEERTAFEPWRPDEGSSAPAADETQIMAAAVPASDADPWAASSTGPSTSEHEAVGGAAGGGQVAEQWAPDPTGRHQYRWWNGQEWTEHVADDGRNGVDPLAR